MGLRARFNMADVARHLQKSVETVNKRIVARLQFLGVKCVREARTNRTFTDQTGNLRSSMGFIVAHDGKIIAENYETALGAPDGEAEGRNLAKQILDEYPAGFVLIVTAGMEYAAAVEAKGYNVLASSEDLATQEWPEMLRKIKRGS